MNSLGATKSLPDLTKSCTFQKYNLQFFKWFCLLSSLPSKFANHLAKRKLLNCWIKIKDTFSSEVTCYTKEKIDLFGCETASNTDVQGKEKKLYKKNNAKKIQRQKNQCQKNQCQKTNAKKIKMPKKSTPKKSTPKKPTPKKSTTKKSIFGKIWFRSDCSVLK